MSAHLPWTLAPYPDDRGWDPRVDGDEYGCGHRTPTVCTCARADYADDEYLWDVYYESLDDGLDEDDALERARDWWHMDRHGLAAYYGVPR